MPSPAALLASPYEPEARYSTKREVEWIGYKVHFTATCEPETPHLIVNVATTPATTPDDHLGESVHASLEQRDLLPGAHLVDKGYTDSQVLVDSQRTYGITPIGPVTDDPSWQARAGTGFDKAHCLVDWDQQVVPCPMGKQSISWLPNTAPKNGMMWEVRFACKDCTSCPNRAQCTRAKKEPRLLGLQAREQYEALQAARQRQTTDAFTQQYAPQAGIESTHAQGIRRCGLRQARYRGLARTHLQHLATAAALNVVRLGGWFAGTPRAKTHCSPFAALKAANEDQDSIAQNPPPNGRGQAEHTRVCASRAGVRCGHLRPAAAARPASEGLQGSHRPRWQPTLGTLARTPDALDGPPSHHQADFVLL
jgi:transposase